jgi:hypothetical protein
MSEAYFLFNNRGVAVVLMTVSFRVLYKIAHKRFAGKTPIAVGLPMLVHFLLYLIAHGF